MVSARLDPGMEQVLHLCFCPQHQNPTTKTEHLVICDRRQVPERAEGTEKEGSAEEVGTRENSDKSKHKQHTQRGGWAQASKAGKRT